VACAATFESIWTAVNGQQLQLASSVAIEIAIEIEGEPIPDFDISAFTCMIHQPYYA
jgi:hypothetical protein